MTHQFQPGKTYQTRSIGDHNCIISCTIASRTNSTVTLTNGKKFRVSEYNGAEQFRPWGSYSMAPIMDARDDARILDASKVEAVAAPAPAPVAVQRPRRARDRRAGCWPLPLPLPRWLRPLPWPLRAVWHPLTCGQLSSWRNAWRLSAPNPCRVWTSKANNTLLQSSCWNRLTDR
jgi:hypothetical protein